MMLVGRDMTAENILLTLREKPLISGKYVLLRPSNGCGFIETVPLELMEHAVIHMCKKFEYVKIGLDEFSPPETVFWALLMELV